MQHWPTTALAVLLLAACNLAPPPDTFPGQPVTQRNKLFKQMLRSFEPIGLMLRGKEEFDANLTIASAKEIKRLAELPWSHFPAGSIYPPSKATPAIWEKPDEFKRAQEDFIASASQLALAASKRDKDALRPAYEDMAKSCKACHKQFRD